MGVGLVGATVPVRPSVDSLGIQWAPVAGCQGHFHGTFGDSAYHAVYDDPIKGRWICLFSDGRQPFRQLGAEDLAAVVEALKGWLGPAAPRGTR